MPLIRLARKPQAEADGKGFQEYGNGKVLKAVFLFEAVCSFGSIDPEASCSGFINPREPFSDHNSGINRSPAGSFRIKISAKAACFQITRSSCFEALASLKL
ncbi:hypothetical protein F0P94_18890 [Adhaeribacter soli]|uniref:Uncharacterized protein n=1 Tax=Adhaeribacter soli TaxID=2607655 RepID=A0A5N1II81_9BACT|nr:hypothetical protein F0P94_18890 [Adhaeribacter soli]